MRGAGGLARLAHAGLLNLLSSHDPAQEERGAPLVEALVVLAASGEQHARRAAAIAAARLDARERRAQQVGQRGAQLLGDAGAAAPPLEEQEALGVRVARAPRALAAEVGMVAHHDERRERHAQVLDRVEGAARVRLVAAPREVALEPRRQQGMDSDQLLSRRWRW